MSKRLMFTEQFVSISAQELKSLRALTLLPHEVGGHIEPRGATLGKCRLQKQPRIIVGTHAVNTSGADAKNYTGKTSKSIKILSTPFTEKNMIAVSKMCGKEAMYCNIIWHTHPLEVGFLSPPSIGDIAAHTVMGNVRHFVRSGRINTQLIVAYEGIYEYGIQEWKFKKILQDVDILMKGQPWKLDAELPISVVSEIRRRVFDELRDSYYQFLDEVKQLVSDFPAHFDKKDAPTHALKDQWLCTDTCDVGDFAYSRALHIPKFKALIEKFNKTNAYMKMLKKQGFYCKFFAYPKGDLKLPVKVA